MTQNKLNELKHREVDLEEFKREKLALEEKIVEDDCVENLQRLAQVIGVIAQISQHKEARGLVEREALGLFSKKNRLLP